MSVTIAKTNYCFFLSKNTGLQVDKIFSDLYKKILHSLCQIHYDTVLKKLPDIR